MVPCTDVARCQMVCTHGIRPQPTALVLHARDIMMLFLQVLEFCEVPAIRGGHSSTEFFKHFAAHQAVRPMWHTFANAGLLLNMKWGIPDLQLNCHSPII